MDQNKPKSPSIGICVSNTKPGFKKLAIERLERYPGDINLITFHIENLNFENLQVKGVYWEKKGLEVNQKKGVFPLPNVIYLQCYVDSKVVKKIERIIGRKVFNSFIFDKWECWELLKKDNELLHHLPYTQKLEIGTNLQDFLYHNKDIFLKPIDPSHAHSSKGIFRVKLQKKRNISVFYRTKTEMQKKGFRSYQEFKYWISPKISTNYIMQKGIQIVKYEERATDIRLHMNKNGKGEWEVSTILFRVATNGSHISPGLFILGMNYLEKMFPKGRDDMNNHAMERAIVYLGTKICNVLDQSRYHMGDLGIDLGVDQNGHIWIFEVNPLPYPYPSAQYHAFTKPIEYALYLASHSKKRKNDIK
jgi:YheC/D like ATP-grasp